MQFLVFEIDKTESKNWNEEKNGQYGNEEFKSFERVLLLL